MNRIISYVALLTSLLVLPCSLQATHGLNLIGTSIRSLGLGGATVAYPQDSLDPSLNPANIAFLEPRWDVGIRALNLQRDYTFTNFGGGYRDSGWNWLLIPYLGGVWRPSRCWALGACFYVNGGSNASYAENNPALSAGQPGGLGDNYEQGVIALSCAYRLAPGHAIGVAPLIGIQRLRVWGAHSFVPPSLYPEDVTDNGYDIFVAGGLRLGYTGRIHPCIQLAASFSTPVWSLRSHKYQGLLPNRAQLDIPGAAHLGAALFLPFRVCLLLQYQRLFYGDILALNNPVQNVTFSRPGAPDGPGLGWESISVYKAGLEWQINACWTARIGYSYGAIPFAGSQMDLNVLTPAVTRHHATIGATYCMGCWGEVSAVYTYAFPGSQRGRSFLGLGEMQINMYQNSFGLAYGHSF